MPSFLWGKETTRERKKEWQARDNLANWNILVVTEKKAKVIPIVAISEMGAT